MKSLAVAFLLLFVHQAKFFNFRWFLTPKAKRVCIQVCPDAPEYCDPPEGYQAMIESWTKLGYPSQECYGEGKEFDLGSAIESKLCEDLVFKADPFTGYDYFTCSPHPDTKGARGIENFFVTQTFLYGPYWMIRGRCTVYFLDKNRVEFEWIGIARYAENGSPVVAFDWCSGGIIKS